MLQALLLVLASTVTGHVERLDAFRSPELQDERDVLVWLPPGYEQGSERYPVVYLQDAQNVFDSATSFAGKEWKADETAAALAAEGRPVIVVAVPNAGEKRAAEYSPFPFRLGAVQVIPRADLYVEFLVRTLKPAIDARFRTRPRPADTIVAGSSMGALVSAYAAVSHPEVFGRAGLLSPSVWVADRALLKWLKVHRPSPTQRFWVDAGTQEGSRPAEMVKDVRALAAALRKGRAAVHLEIADGARHDEDAWARRWPDALRFLLRD